MSPHGERSSFGVTSTACKFRAKLDWWRLGGKGLRAYNHTLFPREKVGVIDTDNSGETSIFTAIVLEQALGENQTSVV